MSALVWNGNGIQTKILWAAIAVLGVVSLGIVALSRGEPVNAAWLVIAAVCIYFIAYRYYALFIANKVLGINANRPTPAVRHNDGLDYVPTNRYVLFGHHFAAIAGAGPLVGPVLAAQMGYLPGTLWILAGVVIAGAVQDMTVLFLSTRRDGRSLGDMVRAEMGPVAGTIAGIGILLICIIILAVLALVVVQALRGSPWGTFTVFCTVPIAIIMGVYGRFIRRGRIAEMSLIGVVLLLAALVYGQTVSQTPALAAYFDLSGPTLALIIIGYGFVASVLPVWLLLAPRDYLSTFMKIGVITLLALAIIIVRPYLQMPSITKFVDGTGPVWAGQPVPVPVHHHRLRLGVRLAFADLVRNHAEDDRERESDPVHRLRRHADGVVRRHHGDDRRFRAASRRLFRHEQRGGNHRHNRRPSRADGIQYGLRGDAGSAHAGRP